MRLAINHHFFDNLKYYFSHKSQSYTFLNLIRTLTYGFNQSFSIFCVSVLPIGAGPNTPWPPSVLRYVKHPANRQHGFSSERPVEFQVISMLFRKKSLLKAFQHISDTCQISEEFLGISPKS